MRIRGWMVVIGAGLFVAGPKLLAQTPAPGNPVITLPKKFPDMKPRKDLPPLPSRNPLSFAPMGIRFGTDEKDVAFFLFDSKVKGATIPDVMYLWIEDHPEFG
ncbi:MAG: hypothetical protein U1E27_06290, partial [Kiritimatiellia bacterium]|nr:hypothetical protein [Kiritimatiellia bacterium]